MVKQLLVCAFSLSCLFVSAQEIFDMPNATGTYLSGINDSGEICGYYTVSSGNTIAFWINKFGDTIILHGPDGNDTYVNATGINNKDQVVGNYGSASNVAAAQSFIWLPNAGRNNGGNYSLVSNWGGINTQASGITDDTCISGSYQVGGNDCGATWCKGNGAPISLRCSNQGTVYPTYAFDINTVNHNTCGFIIQGAQEQAFVYRSTIAAWDTFMVGGNIKSRALGMNDGGWICGNYASTTKGFYAQKIWQQPLSNLRQIIITKAVTIYPSHINNDTDIVGYFTDAQGVDHGFLLAKYDIGFRPSVNGYNWANDAPGCWPSTYYSQFDYTTDPYLNNGSTFPLDKGFHPAHKFYPFTDDSWPDAVKGLVSSGFYLTGHGHIYLSQKAWDIWFRDCMPKFQGHCFGMSYTAALSYENFHQLSYVFPSLSGYLGTTTQTFPHINTVLAAISQMQCKSDYGKEVISWNVAHFKDTVFATLQYIKQELRNSRGKPHHGLAIKLQHAPGGHSVFPYRIAPGINGNGIDSIYIYDPNYPGLDDLFIYCDTKAGLHGNWYYTAGSRHGEWGNSPNGWGIRIDVADTLPSLNNMHISAMPKPWQNYARSTQGFTTAFFNSASVLSLTDDNNGVSHISIDSSTATSLITPLDRLSGLDSIEPTTTVLTGQVTMVNKITQSGDSIQSYMGIYDDQYLIRCDRVSGADGADNYSISPGSLTYLNNTDSGIGLAYSIAMNPDSTHEYNYYFTGLNVPGLNKVTVTNHDSTGVVLQNFGPATTYTITTEFITPDSLITFVGVIPIQANTQHTILPHDTTYSGIYILVDTGMTGMIEDSIFIHQTLTDINRVNAPNISAWPVPSGNELFMSGPQGLVKYNIVDITGRNVASGELDFGNGTTQKFNVANFAPGVYTIAGNGVQGRWTYMFVKE